MSEVVLGISLIGVAINTFYNAFAKQIADEAMKKLFSRKKNKEKVDKDEPVDNIPSAITSKYPLVTGTSIPWISNSGVTEGYSIQNINTEIAIDNTLAVLRLDLKNLNDVPDFNHHNQILNIEIPHHAEVEIEDIIDDNMDLNVPLESTIVFDAPIRCILQNDIYYNSNYIDVPFEFTRPPEDPNNIRVMLTASTRKLELRPKKTQLHDLKPLVRNPIQMPYFDM